MGAMKTYQFEVVGRPVPKGSMKAYMAKGARFPIVTHDNESTKPWQATVAATAHAVCQGNVTRAPVAIEIECFFGYRKSDFGTGRNAGALKPSAPTHHTTKPDADKLGRCIGDALKGVVYADDSQVVEITVRKAYTLEHEHARIRVTVLEGHEACQ